MEYTYVVTIEDYSPEADEYVHKQILFDVLCDYGLICERGFIEPIPVRHGSCCTCQECGFNHDECVCLNNQLIMDLGLEDYTKE